MSKFQAHYRISVQRDDDALFEVCPDVKVPAIRTPEADIDAVKQAIATARALTVGADGRCEFKGYTVYVSYYESFGESDLLATVERGYSFDTDSDYTFARAHAGNMADRTVAALSV